MNKIKIINNLLLTLLLLGSILLIAVLINWTPRIIRSTINVNNAKCLESYYNQGQPPLGACGYDFTN
ncbi:MAG: hypothetical protein US83_C0010G0010 [Candidatus Falkowbacteria bacterium GW2011_GWC2_38_22]|uniref:Uncharacterized protein n=1 Tax=Candidatus Falkowbacteria bacterium GW2011_GWE1_38_31 TaxID=1618638 RepID=A0A0G0M9B8_9BACT|nr:MAG: hypothetical protein US73_C0005G0010 [Candidatus Falkowbacteria bacterium GW2011_GWF2_38_1205]KKQ60976.1 MAG: hypothetical protein US83_C0010G0010 [Candidatus Falkowbacteria bacterium GW2011_GWC2_38_22]KKQ63495.1 MAG: hypothetical protein US84_C0006G0098 [Candidatus Falkowbacteria bacterium GW2011_GWF1_38_22]KKQ65434.1 MAG: hypothetical protein US87_C0007G0010 [Candidatus Falkowbacteria bacterium GW2011_GWE2_38_254]KKQ70259.1 MAG: hypothetical protein US91_C0006G0098 [Candidatus Falkowb